MGTSRAWVSRVLRGENNLTIASMGKLAFALGMRVRADLAPLEAQSGAEAARAPDTVEPEAQAVTD